MLEITDLEKSYAGGVRALRGVSLAAGAGVLGLLTLSAAALVSGLLVNV